MYSGNISHIRAFCKQNGEKTRDISAKKKAAAFSAAALFVLQRGKAVYFFSNFMGLTTSRIRWNNAYSGGTKTIPTMDASTIPEKVVIPIA